MGISFPGFPHEVPLNIPEPYDQNLLDRMCWAEAEFGCAALFAIEDVQLNDASHDEIYVRGTLQRDGPWVQFGGTFLFKDQTQAAMFRVFWG